MPRPRNNISGLANKHQIPVLLAILAALVIITFAPYGFVNFLQRLDKGEPLALALLISIMGVGFLLLHKLGFGIAYKEEIGTLDPDATHEH